jgi:hypothetical protein
MKVDPSGETTTTGQPAVTWFKNEVGTLVNEPLPASLQYLS